MIYINKQQNNIDSADTDPILKGYMTYDKSGAKKEE